MFKFYITNYGATREDFERLENKVDELYDIVKALPLDDEKVAELKRRMEANANKMREAIEPEPSP